MKDLRDEIKPKKMKAVDPISQILDENFISVERHTRLEKVSQQVTQRNRSHLEEDFIITENGYYFGVGQVIDLLKMITELQLKSAQNSNPLTGLPRTP